MTTAALVLAAGRGERLGRKEPKAFVGLCGRSLLARSVSALCAAPEIDWVQPVLPPDAGQLPEDETAWRHSKLLDPVPGGDERQDSVRLGLTGLPESVEFVAVHDAARCLVTPESVSAVVRAAWTGRAALLASPVSDTIKRVQGRQVIETPPRSECWAAQTPQVFAVDLLRDALELAWNDVFLGTDDAELVERMGVPVEVVLGESDNFKITHPEDLARAERVLADRGEA